MGKDHRRLYLAKSKGLYKELEQENRGKFFSAKLERNVEEKLRKVILRTRREYVSLISGGPDLPKCDMFGAE